MRLFLTYSAAFFVFGFFSCKNPCYEEAHEFASWNMDFEAIDFPGKQGSGPYQGQFYSHTDKVNLFSPGVNYGIPDSIQGFIRVCVDVYARIKKRRFGQSIVISVQRSDTTFFWQDFDINKYSFKKDTWIHIVDSAQFYKDKSYNDGRELRIFGFNSYEEGELDLDNLKVKLKKVTVICKD